MKMMRTMLATAAAAVLVLPMAAQAAIVTFLFEGRTGETANGTPLVDRFSIDSTAGFFKPDFPGFLYFRTIGNINGFDTFYVGDDGQTGTGSDAGSRVDPVYAVFLDPPLYSGSGRTIDFVAGVYRSTNSANTLTISLAGAVPEPATWGMMILGFGAVGGALRIRRRAGVSYAA